MSNKLELALGTTPLGEMSERQAMQLLSQSIELGINKFDTAPIYQSAEEYLGKFFRKTSTTMVVNTKYGLPKPSIITGADIRNTVERSLSRLSGIGIKTLFIHSLPFRLLTEEVIGCLKILKSQAYFERLGYSGDNEDLQLAISSRHFDDFMLTLNAIDMKNYNYIPQIANDQGIYIKRPIANAVWRNLKTKQLKNQFFKLLGARRSRDEQNYRFRFEKIAATSPVIAKPYLNTFTRFLSELDFNRTIVIGTSKGKHLAEISNLFTKYLAVDEKSVLSERLEVWQKLSKYDWQAIR
jgi:aryl-alcohol dehydrogenase-like predicted oxidoreductase